MGAFNPIIWVVAILWWVCVFTMGFFTTIMWTIIITAVTTIITIVREKIRV